MITECGRDERIGGAMNVKLFIERDLMRFKNIPKIHKKHFRCRKNKLTKAGVRDLRQSQLVRLKVMAKSQANLW